MRFYTWKDIERYILMHHDEWKDELYDIEVYPNEMVVYPKSEQGTLQNAVLKKLFPKNIAPDNLSIKLDGQGEDLMILYEYEYSPVTVRTLPLFKKAIYEDSIYPTEQLADLSCPVFAFHSYKGGVGRTLSLIAFARAWTNLQKNPENSKLLIIDSDLEAPGLTLIQGDLNDSAFSSAEALKLAVWLVSHANSDFYRESIPIENASQEIIDKYLEELWGLKLGKKDSNEAYSSRWILAALSDFNGQLQARDIIRFLKYAAGQNMKKPPYDDRILMPAEIRYAVPKCSNAKISDIKAEYENLKPIFEKLEDLPTDEKTLPMNLENNIFTSAEEKSMTQSGYLKRDGEKLYLPEIIRHALGFRYEKGARPRVLSLLLKH